VAEWNDMNAAWVWLFWSEEGQAASPRSWLSW
jgi:hypothetical protein